MSYKSVYTGAQIDAGIANVGSLVNDKSLSESGYQKLPSGLILQWGVVTVTDNYASHAFPIPFPNACLAVTANPLTYNGSIIAATAYTKSLLQVKGSYDPGSGVQCGYMAIGY